MVLFPEIPSQYDKFTDSTKKGCPCGQTGKPMGAMIGASPGNIPGEVFGVES